MKKLFLSEILRFSFLSSYNVLQILNQCSQKVK